MPLILHGYHYSVYNRIARLALAEKGVAYERAEVNPFDPAMPAAYRALHPFGRVPTLVHDGFVLYETGAITRYIDRCFAGPALQPGDPRSLARMDQIIGIVDSYAYWALVRQVYVHAVGLPRRGQAGDEKEVIGGLAAAAKVLAALESLAGDATFLVGAALSLADLQLVAMMTYFIEAPQGAEMLTMHPKLHKWFALLSARQSFKITDPK